MQRITLSEKRIDELKIQFQAVLYILPVTLKEYRWAIAMSIAVGVFEEIIL